MRVCILGENLTSLTLAKALLRLKIRVDIISNNKKVLYPKSRSLGISKSNIDYFNNHIVDIKKLSWNLDKIEIFTDNIMNKNLLNFDNDRKFLFSTIKNYQLFNLLKKEVIKFKSFKKKKVFINNNYDLIINTDFNHYITKKFFYKRLGKDYHGSAYTTIIKHKKISNNTATQIFTINGPIAYLPISNYETSLVFSINKKMNFDNEFIKSQIKKFNLKYKILKISNIEKFNLSSFHLRSYYHKNILAFGDLIHRVHPLAGQGFNMTLRDIQSLVEIINDQISLGLPIDSSICREFEKKNKHKNFIFSQGIDLIYEFFNFERKTDNIFLNKTINLFGKNKSIMKTLSNIADNGYLT